jgi:hypothetical protein
LRAAAAHCDNKWPDVQLWRDFVRQATSPSETTRDCDVEIDLQTVLCFSAALDADDSRLDATLTELLAARESRVRKQLAGRVMRQMLESGRPIAGHLEQAMRGHLATIGADAQRRRLTSAQTLLLDALATCQYPAVVVGRMLPARLVSRDWLAATALLRLVPLAASVGHDSALSLMQRMAEKPGSFTAEQLDTVMATPIIFITSAVSPLVYDAAVTIALKTDRYRDLIKFVAGATWGEPLLKKHLAKIVSYAKHQLTKQDEEPRKETAALLAAVMNEIPANDFDWAEFRHILDRLASTDRNPLIQAMGLETDKASIQPRLKYLTELVTINPNAHPPISRTDVDEIELSTAGAALISMRQLLCIQVDPDPDLWPTIRVLGEYELEQNRITAVGTAFVTTCFYLQRLAVEAPVTVSGFFLEYLIDLSEGTFIGLNNNLWAEEVTDLTNTVCRQRDGALIPPLVKVAGRLGGELSQTILLAVARRYYRQAKPHLTTLAATTTDEDLRVSVTTLVRQMDRAHGTREFAAILN